MQKLLILNTREVKKIRRVMLDAYGYFPEEDYAYLLNEKRFKLNIINKDLARIDLRKLRVDKIGLYFAEFKNNQIRLSKEGSQLLYNLAKKNKKELKNVVDLDKDEVKRYFKGENLMKNLGKDNRFVILKHGEDILGCAKYKEKTILNFLPKIHRGEVII